MTEKTILLTLVYIIGLGELALAVFFWATHSKSEIRKVMALLAFSTGMWVISNALSSYTQLSSFVWFALRLDLVFGTIIVTTLVYLAVIFPYRLWNFDNLHKYLLFIPALFFSLVSVTGSLVISDYTVSNDSAGIIAPGYLFTHYQIFIALYFVTSLVILHVKTKKLEGINKKNTFIVFWSILLGGLPAVIISSFRLEYFILASLFSFLWLAGTTYIVVKK